MSRGGIGKSKKQPPASRPMGRRRREPRQRVRVEQKPRPRLAAGVGGVMLGLSAFVLFVGLVLISSEQDGGQSAVSLGLVTLPLGFATVAMLSQRQPVILQTLYAFVTAVVAAFALFIAIAVTGFGAFFTSVTVGLGLGGLLAFREPPESSVRTRLVAIGILTGGVLVCELLGLVLLAVVGPFAVMPALNFVDNRAVLRAAGLSDAESSDPTASGDSTPEQNH